MIDAARWNPAWSLSPGEVLVEALEERGMTQAELGRRMARPLKTISEIATGRTAITPDTAIQLERTLGISAATWLGLESRYRESQARERDLAELQGHREWLRKFPVKELMARGILTRGPSGPQQAAELLAFFGVSNPAGWERYWGEIAASYRMSEKVNTSPYAVAAWLREAELEAEGVELPAYDAVRLRAQLSELRRLSRSPVGAALARIRELLVGSGVGLLVTEGLRGAPASGAVRWIRGGPWIILTLRYRTDDQLWFSLFHEVGHLLEGGRRQEVIEELQDDGSTRDDEQAANTLAREALLPSADLGHWLDEVAIDRSTIKEFAAAQDIAPGIVVGRLQRDGRVSPRQFNDLKRSL